MTAGSTIDYEALAQEAMRGIVRTVLQRAAKSGLPGEHHFYISFDTTAQGVALSKRLRDKYPNEMTIVLQHRFWDLAVTDDRFEVKLTFDGIPERLVVPFSAIKVFFDPSVRYGLQFEEPDAVTADPAGPDLGEPEITRPPAAARVATATRKPRAPRKGRTEKEGAEDRPAPGLATSSADKRPAAAPAPSAKPASAPASEKPADVKPLASTSPAGTAGGAQIVSLDQFRKK
jgi:hypothetical protein